eukprot:2713705-Amphidinium_carterae.1
MRLRLRQLGRSPHHRMGFACMRQVEKCPGMRVDLPIALATLARLPLEHPFINSKDHPHYPTMLHYELPN